MLFHVRKDYNRLSCLRIRGLYNPQLIVAFLRRLSPCEFYCPVKPDVLFSDRIFSDYLVLDVALHPCDELNAGTAHPVELGRIEVAPVHRDPVPLLQVHVLHGVVLMFLCVCYEEICRTLITDAVLNVNFYSGLRLPEVCPWIVILVETDCRRVDRKKVLTQLPPPSRSQF